MNWTETIRLGLYFVGGIIVHQSFRVIVPDDRPVLEIGLTIFFYVGTYVVVFAIEKWRARRHKR